jgi:lysophospholipase
MARAMRWLGRGGAYIPGGDKQPSGPEDFVGNVLTSDPVRFARNLAIVAEEPDLALGPPTMTIAWADAALRQMRDFSNPSYAAHIRQPMLLVAAGYDQVVWTPAIEDFGMYLLAGRHLILPGARHEILQEQDQFRAQFWAAFDAFVPGTPRY